MGGQAGRGGVPAVESRRGGQGNLGARAPGGGDGPANKKGGWQFTLPGLLKISAVSGPAKPKRKGSKPFTKEEQWFAAKPASVKVKVRPLKKLKDAAAG